MQAIRENEDLQLKLRGVTTAAIVKGFAQQLVDSSDSLAIHNFANPGWDGGELVWAAKTWEQAD